jgi:anti-sigma B factor antagonist
LSIEVGSNRGRVVVAPEGEVDFATAPLLEETLVGAQSSNAAQVLVDLTAVTFIDAAGLQTLLRAYARSRQEGSRLRITEGPPQVQRLFDIAGVRDELPFVGS